MDGAMKRVTFLKILLILVAGGSAIIPLRRLMARKDLGPLTAVPSPVAEPAVEPPAVTPPAPASVDTFASPPDPDPKPEVAVPVVTPPRRTISPPPASPLVSETQKTYIVQEGDSFWSIAEKELGSGTHAKKIIEANRDRVDVDNLKVGQVIIIPDIDAAVRRYR
jgi:nucleoid-associated protein YgaU